MEGWGTTVALIIERVSPPGRQGSGGNEVATVVNREVSCLKEHHGATCGCAVRSDA